MSARSDAIYWPTHGGPIRRPQAHVRELIDHRLARQSAIRKALAEGPTTPRELVARIYVGLDPRLTEAAAQSVLAHLLALRQSGLALEEGGSWRAMR